MMPFVSRDLYDQAVTRAEKAEKRVEELTDRVLELSGARPINLPLASADSSAPPAEDNKPARAPLSIRRVITLANRAASGKKG